MPQPAQRSTSPEDAKKFETTDVRIEHGKLGNNHNTDVVYYVDGERRVYVPGSPEERRMVRKIDFHMFTCVTVLYLLNYLDRQNVSLALLRSASLMFSKIGNAKVGGMQEDLKLSSSDYSVAL